MKAVLLRIRELSNRQQTCGRFLLMDDDANVVFNCAALELPWQNNLRSMSCIPAGTYTVTKVISPRYGKDTFKVLNVPQRSEILIHHGNFTRDTEGCILLGERFTDLDSDEITDVSDSKATVNKLKALADSFELTIVNI